MYRNYIKPGFDFIASSILLITLSPLILIVIFILFFLTTERCFSHRQGQEKVVLHLKS